MLETKDNDDGEVQVTPVDDGFARYFVPQPAKHRADDQKEDAQTELTVQNFGQYANDLAWDYSNPPSSREEYEEQSALKNIVQLVWRLEFDPALKCLRPSWPVSVVTEDIVLTNADDFMEIGTQYGWTYWQALEVESK
eukprot:gnl/TRDRNA2_/TRDRNA2_87801_c0_seq1.p1 gnl/TRDRNA2_/TRDRNA2_87801_c0~~gnl/TRDRNA2_/TRDRNA2_87801_c0_seq1.p1  ORF type:complete len:138 (+),score=18.19 gnl/TRDRNA2_/TRDRNA2_87801_c0_seq1:604-1017(+)